MGDPDLRVLTGTAHCAKWMDTDREWSKEKPVGAWRIRRMFKGEESTIFHILIPSDREALDVLVKSCVPGKKPRSLVVKLGESMRVRVPLAPLRDGYLAMYRKTEKIGSSDEDVGRYVSEVVLADVRDAIVPTKHRDLGLKEQGGWCYSCSLPFQCEPTVGIIVEDGTKYYVHPRCYGDQTIFTFTYHTDEGSERNKDEVVEEAMNVMTFHSLIPWLCDSLPATPAFVAKNWAKFYSRFLEEGGHRSLKKGSS